MSAYTSPDKPVQITRIPYLRPGDRVQVPPAVAAEGFPHLAGRWREVAAVSAAITEPDQRYPVWWVRFTTGERIPARVLIRDGKPGHRKGVG